MIYLDDERLTKEVFPEEFKFYEEKMEEIRKKKHIAQGEKTYNFLDMRPIRLGLDGRKEPKKNFSFPSEEAKDGMRWTWCKSSTVDKNGARSYQPPDILFNERLSLNPQNKVEAEQIFFLLFVSKQAQRIMQLQNLEEEARQENLQQSAEVDVRFLIMSPNSPLSVRNCGNDKVLRNVASAWYVPHADTMSIEMLKKRLFETVVDSEKNKASTKRGFQEFSIEVNSLPDLETRSNIQKAVDNEVIHFIEDKGKKVWKYTHTDKTLLVVQHWGWARPNLALEEYLNRNPRSKEEFDEILNIYLKGIKEPEVNGEPEEKKATLSEEKIDEMHHATVRSILNKNGIKVDIKAKAPEIRQKAKDNIQKLIVV